MGFSSEHTGSGTGFIPPRMPHRRPRKPSEPAGFSSGVESHPGTASSVDGTFQAAGTPPGGEASDDGEENFDAKTGASPSDEPDGEAHPGDEGPAGSGATAGESTTSVEAGNLLNKMLDTLVHFKGSDLHLKTGVSPRIRVDGDLHTLELGELSSEQLHLMIECIVPETLQEKYFRNRKEADFSYTSPLGARFRVNAFYQRGNPSVVFRFVAVTPPTLDDLEMPEVIGRLADNHRGLVLVTGPTGSGKTTTLAAMIDRINSSRAATIVTIEDPIEVMHTDRECLIQQREIGLDTEDFHTALRSVLRQDPDVILVGEMRDTETVRAALSAAETGHLVFSTLHTLNAQETVNRIIDFFPPHERKQMRLTLAGTLNGIICQRLVQKQSGGRTAVMEILVNTGRISEAIADEEETKNLTKIISESEYDGMVTFDQNLVDMFRRDIIGYDDMLNASSNPHNIRAYLKKVGLLPGQ